MYCADNVLVIKLIHPAGNSPGLTASISSRRTGVAFYRKDIAFVDSFDYTDVPACALAEYDEITAVGLSSADPLASVSGKSGIARYIS